jgi:hypothetical protein
MKRLISGLCAAVALTGLAACADSYDRGYGGGLYVSGGDYDGYYDDYYGPIYDGYWDGDEFYFRDQEGHPWRRDSEHHFRHDQASGFHHIHGAMHGARPHDHDGDR